MKNNFSNKNHQNYPSDDFYDSKRHPDANYPNQSNYNNFDVDNNQKTGILGNLFKKQEPRVDIYEYQKNLMNNKTNSSINNVQDGFVYGSNERRFSEQNAYSDLNRTMDNTVISPAYNFNKQLQKENPSIRQNRIDDFTIFNNGGYGSQISNNNKHSYYQNIQMNDFDYANQHNFNNNNLDFDYYNNENYNNQNENNYYNGVQNNDYGYSYQNKHYNTPNYSISERMHNNVAAIIPNQIIKEIRSEKFRTLFLFLLGALGITYSSLMLAGHYYTNNNHSISWMGIGKEKFIDPVLSVFLLTVGVTFFILSVTDYMLLISNVKKYEYELVRGNVIVPYFITRNYKSIISRTIYMNWISFSIYVFGGLILGILFAIQGKPFLGWTIPKMQYEIAVNIVILFITLVAHIFSILTGRARKSNIISYYGYEIIPPQEIEIIKKKTNKICMIIFFILIAILLFAIIIPWMFFRKRDKKSIWPWKN